VNNWRTIRTARKAHTCDECSRTINPGQSYVNGAQVWEGEFSNHKLCMSCDSLWGHLWAEHAPPHEEDAPPLGDLREYLNEVECVCFVNEGRE
jgi:hypothetical protein